MYASKNESHFNILKINIVSGIVNLLQPKQCQMRILNNLKKKKACKEILSLNKYE